MSLTDPGPTLASALPTPALLAALEASMALANTCLRKLVTTRRNTWSLNEC